MTLSKKTKTIFIMQNQIANVDMLSLHTCSNSSQRGNLTNTFPMQRAVKMVLTAPFPRIREICLCETLSSGLFGHVPTHSYFNLDFTTFYLLPPSCLLAGLRAEHGHSLRQTTRPSELYVPAGGGDQPGIRTSPRQ